MSDYIAFLEQCECLVFGWFRECNKLYKILVPSEVKFICLEYVKPFYFRWDRENAGKNVQFLDDKTIQISHSEPHGCCNISVMDGFISSEMCNFFCWQIKINKIKKSNLNMYFGWVNYPIAESIKQWDTYLGSSKSNTNTFGIRLNQNKIFWSPLNLFWRRFGAINDEIYDFKKGDTMKMIFNFKQKNEMILYFNDEKIETLDENIADKIVPAVTLIGNNDEITVTNAECWM
eukprot:77617_1